MHLWSQRQGVGAGGGLVPYDIQFLIVAGGGSGGGFTTGSGGGGAGGFRALTASEIPLSTNYTVTIGAGGAAQGSNASGNQGNVSSVVGTGINQTSLGGGFGGRGQSGGTEHNDAANGSSGGGAGMGSNNNQSAGSGTSGQGNNGGTTIKTSGGNGNGVGAGGGGASAVGSNATGSNNNYNGGDGGAGSKWLEGNAPDALDGPYAGGGGGGTAGYVAAVFGNGGTGGGGRGARWSNQTGSEVTDVAIAATVNSGGGGGGSIGFGSGVGSAGGSGIVIIRYQADSQIGTGGTVSSSGGYIYHKFTSSGTFGSGS